MKQWYNLPLYWKSSFFVDHYYADNTLNPHFKRKFKLNFTSIGLSVCHLFKLNGLLQLEFNIILEFDRSIRQKDLGHFAEYNGFWFNDHYFKGNNCRIVVVDLVIVCTIIFTFSIHAHHFHLSKYTIGWNYFWITTR